MARQSPSAASLGQARRVVGGIRPWRVVLYRRLEPRWPRSTRVADRGSHSASTSTPAVRPGRSCPWSGQ